MQNTRLYKSPNYGSIKKSPSCFLITDLAMSYNYLWTFKDSEKFRLMSACAVPAG